MYLPLINRETSVKKQLKEAGELIASKGLKKEWESHFEQVAKAAEHAGYGFSGNISCLF